jgi:hypothetical protein
MLVIKVFCKDMDRDTMVLLAARENKIETQDVIDVVITNMLSDPREVKWATPFLFLFQ